MILWIILAAMTAIAVLVVLVPLMRQRREIDATDASDVAVYKDQLNEVKHDFNRGVLAESEAESARAEIARRLLKAADNQIDDAGLDGKTSGIWRRLTAGFALVCIPAFSLGLYILYGTPGLPNQPFAERKPVDAPRLVAEEESTKMLIARAEDHLAKNPDDIQGWKILAPIYARLRRFSDASFALKRVMTLSSGDPKATVDYAESLIVGNRGDVSPQAVKIFEEVLKTNPNMPRPLHYIALADAQAGRLKEAAVKWRALLKSNPQDAPWRADIERLAAKAEGKELPEVKTASRSAPSGNVTAPVGNQLPALSKEQMNAANSMDEGSRQQLVATMVKRLSDRLTKDGGPVGEWVMLARTQKVLGKIELASTALTSAETAYAGNAEALEQLRNARLQLGLERVASATPTPSPTPPPVSASSDLPQGSRPPALSQEQMDTAGSMDASSRQKMIVSMVKRLSDRLAENGGSVGEWVRLARTQMVLGKTDSAKQAMTSAETAYASQPEALEQLKNARIQLGIEP